MTTRTKDAAERYKVLLDRVDKTPGLGPQGECWEYTGTLNHNGYALVGYAGKSWLLHRLVYTKEVGSIPAGAVIMHSCDNRKCCNPNHLRPGTPAQNNGDMRTKGRDKIAVIIPKPEKKPLNQSKAHRTGREHYYLKKYGRSEAEVKALRS